MRRSRLVAVLVVAIVLGGFTLGGLARRYLGDVENQRGGPSDASPGYSENQRGGPSAGAPPVVVRVPAAVSKQSPEPEFAPRTEAVELHRGDTLVAALARHGLEPPVVNEIAALLKKHGADLRRLKPSDPIALVWSLDGTPLAMRWEPSPWIGYAVIATDDGWQVRRRETKPDVRLAVVKGEVKTSLFQAIDDAKESAQLVLDVVEMFASDFDFTADTRAGDRFRLVVEKRYAGETFVDYGRVLAAQYVSDAKTLTGVGFEPPRGKFGYFDTGGRSLKKSFLKSPLEFSRITSGFAYARPHPILGGVRPHLAIDYAAPVGTPVRAVADALVLSAGWDDGNGISVHLRHRAGFETMYNHLSKTAAGIRPGARVGQRQVIGYVGMTGLATGPHLDFRVARNGIFVNPMNEKYLPGEPISGAERARFQRHARELIARLETEAPF
ncbi:MAG: M23 family metallopeptidase [Candidatus Rokubacteria bacterium]|nr:M23 family metallopeptidase [Candidatus Rokubacteria bacterium]